MLTREGPGVELPTFHTWSEGDLFIGE